MKKLLWTVGVVAVLAVFAAPAHATSITFGFNQCVAGTPQDCAIGEAQISVGVSNPGSGQAAFTFANTGSVASVLDAVYFSDGTLLGIAAIVNANFVKFSQGATPPELPGGNTASPKFVTTQGFLADADNPGTKWGVSPGEQLTIVFNLINNKTYSDTIASLNNGSLRIGVHVISINNLDQHSVSLINNPQPVPEPGTLLMLGAGLTGLAAIRRRRV